MTKVFVVGGDYLVKLMFLERGFDTIVRLEDADLICFTGGADVSPHFYGEKNRGLSYCSEARDASDFAAYKKAGDKPKAGICRGGQFLNVMSGGKMVQHVDGHAIRGAHTIFTVYNEVIETTSTHHQQLDPDFSKCELIAVAEQDVGVEIVYYPETKSLCFQGHPEYGNKDCENYFFKLINQKFGF